MTAVQKVETQAPDNITAASLAVIERAARDPNTDVEKMERLFALHERLLLRDAEAAFNDAMHLAQSQMPQVARDASNETTRSRYTRLETLSAAASPIIAANGFSLSYGTDESPLPDHYRIICDVAHKGGFTKPYHVDLPIDNTGMKGTKNKTDTHGAVSAISYGRRVLKLLIFDIATKDDDGNAAAGIHPISVDQYDALKKRIADVQADEEKFCEYLGVGDLRQLHAIHFDRAIKALNAKASKQ